jgi:hypothetical protein
LSAKRRNKLKKGNFSRNKGIYCGKYVFSGKMPLLHGGDE